jgi:ABC-type bacteriocin/lantibiotic exporter with double-glycine peptidase domain
MLFQYIRVFYDELGNRLIALLALLFLAAIFEALSVGMILPLLQTESNPNDSILARAINSITDFIGIGTGITSILVLMTALFFMRGAFMIAQSMYQAKIISDHLVQMRTKLITSLFRARFSFLISRETGYFTNAITGELEKVNASLRQLGVLAVWTTTSIVYTVLALMFHPAIFLFIAVLLIPIAIIAVIVNRKTQEASVQRSLHAGQHQSLLVEAVQHSKYIMATGRKDIITSRIIVESRRIGDLYRRMMRLGSISEYGFEPFAVLVLASIVWFYTQILDQPMTEVIFLIVIFYQGSKSILAVQPAYRKFLQSAGSLQLYRELSQELSQNRREKSIAEISPDYSGDIEFTNVAVKYYGQEIEALKDVTLSIPARKTVAFVGPSGSGKSTVANLLTGLIDPTSGSISLSGDSYSDLNIDELQSKISYVTQEPVVFQGSVHDNITMWESDPDLETARELLSKVGLAHLTGRAGDGQSTYIRSSGSDISGGERQRVSIARELYRPFDLIILDEATSSLDSKLESKIEEYLSGILGAATVVIISHRLSTIRHADIIYVLDQGRIIETGGYDELVKLNGQFTAMVKSQEL